jgi:hypothetical protein
MWANPMGLPLELKNVRGFKNSPQGTLDWSMHQSCGISSVVWKDKNLVLPLTTHVMPIGFPCLPVNMAPIYKKLWLLSCSKSTLRICTELM